MKISHPEHGGNGESRGVVNQWLRLQEPAGDAKLLREIISQVRFSISRRILFDCATRQSFCPSLGNGY
jgi:hypothetical protein